MKNHKIGIIIGGLAVGLILSIALKAQAAGDAWETTVGGSAYLSDTSYGETNIAYHPTTHDPYIAVVDLASSIQLKHFDGTSWENVGSSVTSGELDEVRLAFNPITNQPYLAYWDITIHKVVVVRYDGSSWVDVGPHGITDSDGTSLSFAFNPGTGNPYLAYWDHGNDKSAIKMFNGSSWENVGPTSFTDGDTYYTSLAFNPATNEPYVAIDDEANGDKLRVIKYTGSWENVGDAGISSGKATHVNMAFDENAVPYVVYTEKDLGKALKVKKFTGGAWQDVGNPMGDDPSGEVGRIAFCPSTNVPYVAYITDFVGNNIVVRKYNGDSWELVGTKGFNTSEAIDLDLSFHPATNEPYLAFEDYNPSDSSPIYYHLAAYKFNKAVSNRPAIAYKNKKSAKKNVTFTFKDLKITTKKAWVKVWLGGKKQKVRSVKKSGNNLKVALRVKYGQWAQGNYNLRMQFKKKVGKHTHTDNWRSLNALTIN